MVCLWRGRPPKKDNGGGGGGRRGRRAGGLLRDHMVGRATRAFSSEVEAGSRQENASKQESRAPLQFYRSGKGSSGAWVDGCWNIERGVMYHSRNRNAAPCDSKVVVRGTLRRI